MKVKYFKQKKCISRSAISADVVEAEPLALTGFKKTKISLKVQNKHGASLIGIVYCFTGISDIKLKSRSTASYNFLSGSSSSAQSGKLGFM